MCRVQNDLSFQTIPFTERPQARATLVVEWATEVVQVIEYTVLFSSGAVFKTVEL